MANHVVTWPWWLYLFLLVSGIAFVGGIIIFLAKSLIYIIPAVFLGWLLLRFLDFKVRYEDDYGRESGRE